jgi:hypothetical protein
MGRESRLSRMKRRFTFSDKQEFRLVYEAFVTRGSSDRDKKYSKEDHRSEARILKVLKSISEPDGPEPINGSPDLRMRVLRGNNLSIELEQNDFKRLCEYFDNTQWAAGLTDVIVDLSDRLDTAEKVE